LGGNIYNVTALTSTVRRLSTLKPNRTQDTVTVAAMRMADSLLNPILGESHFVRGDDDDVQSAVLRDPMPNCQPAVVFRVVDLLRKELIASANPNTTLGCYEALVSIS
jgi:hypothetical protein